MSYITTKLQPLKSYPTYQFYAKADSKSLKLDDVFKICILETLKWIRARLNEFNNLPNEMMTPDPNDYDDFSDDLLVSFSYINGLNIDVIYIEKNGIWTFKISESDMGANIGKKGERPPVNGRTFNTEIALRKQKDFVEIGVRTICSEPSEITEECEVFRPTVVKALAENKNIRLTQSNFILNGKPLEIKTNTDLQRFFNIYEDDFLNFPIILVADSKTETMIPELPTLDSVLPFSWNNGLTDNETNVVIDSSMINLKNTMPIAKEKTKKQKLKSSAPKIETKEIKPPILDYNELAKKLIGFSIVVFAEDKFFKQIENKTQIKPDYGDVIIINHQTEIEHHKYSEYSDDIDGFFKVLRSEAISMPKRKSYSFGKVLFYSDAKLKDYHTKRHETTSLEEKCCIYRLENAELKVQVKELSQHNTDMQQTTESLRLAQKKIDSLQNELECKGEAYNELYDNVNQKELAYHRNAELISFYKQQIEIAAKFPTNKDDVCDWIEDNFSEYLAIAPRAKSEMKKYSGKVDIANLCDGILFLNAYSRFRRKEISDDVLQLYAERNNWEIQNCGKEAIKMRKSDYTVTYNQNQYILDLHIKRGVKAEELIRVYFCWDDEIKKLIIGSMPEHLATVKMV